MKKIIISRIILYLPKLAPQPLKEDSLLTGPIGTHNEPYAIAKIAGVKMLMHTGINMDAILYLPCRPIYMVHDNYDLLTSHVLPALLRKFIEATKRGDERVILWGTGTRIVNFYTSMTVRMPVYFWCIIMINRDISVSEQAKDLMIKDLAASFADIAGFKGNNWSRSFETGWNSA